MMLIESYSAEFATYDKINEYINDILPQTLNDILLRPHLTLEV